MAPSRSLSATRAICALLIALLLSIRLLTPAGFMPAFERGELTIVPCPDAGSDPAMTGHHSGHSKRPHQPCPYGSASGLGAVTADLPLLAALLVAGMALLLGRPFSFIEKSDRRLRPPLRGPPLPA